MIFSGDSLFVLLLLIWIPFYFRFKWWLVRKHPHRGWNYLGGVALVVGGIILAAWL